MSLPIESAPSSIGTVDGAEHSDLAVLETPDCAELQIPADFLFAHFFLLDAPVELATDCAHCGERRLFRGDRECVWGLIAKCTECGEERIVTNSEAA